MERAQIKECWHQNITACHFSSVTEFKSMQQKKCEDNSFHKTCKISFKEVALNYTVRTCHKPLVQKCSYHHHHHIPVTKCRTWFETTCNTTLVVDAYGSHKGGQQAWCEKIPKKICAPDHCAMVEGPEVCHDKNIYSTMMKPEETCDLQPTTDCQIVTSLIPHLRQRKVCESVPKEFCHIKLDSPKMVKKPITMKWCTFVNGNPAPPTHGPTKPSHALNHTTLLPLYYQHPTTARPTTTAPETTTKPYYYYRPEPTTAKTTTPKPTTTYAPETTTEPYYYYRPEPTTAKTTTPEPTTTYAPETTTRPYYYYRPEPTTPRPYPETTTPPEPTTAPYYYYQPTPSVTTTPKPTPPPTTPYAPPTTTESYYPYYQPEQPEQPEQPRPTPQQNDRIPSIFNGFLNQHQQHHSK